MAVAYAPSNAEMLLVVLRNYSSADGSIYITIKTLERILGLGRYEIIDLIWQLEDAGFIQSRETHGDGLRIRIDNARGIG
jgi:hypothetical protein